MKSVIIDRFSVSNVNFERYSDGGCVIENHNPGFLELSAETVGRLAGVSLMQNITKPADMSRGVPQPVGAKASVHKHSPTLKEAQRSINRLPSGLWQCEFTASGVVVATQRYASRDWARKGTITTPVGESGRVS
jgi:hypothetical protein